MTGIIFDSVIIGVGAIALIVGLIRGFAKQLGKGFCSLAGIVGAFAVCFVVMNLIKTAPWSVYTSFVNITSGWFAEGTGLGNFAQSLTGIEAVAKALNDTYGGNVALMFGTILADVIFDVVLWLISYLVIKYVLYGIASLLKLLAKVPVFKSIDRLFGGMWAVLVTYAIVVVVLYTAVVALGVKFGSDGGAFAELLDGIKNGVSESAVFKYVHEYNIVGAAWAKSLFKIDVIGFAVL